MKKEIIIVADYSETETVTFTELRDSYDITDDFIRELIAHQIIHMDAAHPGQWLFDGGQLKRVLTAMRLQRDLEVNLAGIALVLDLMEEMDELRARAEFLEKHILK